jgi:pilus assembly protein CpaE
MNSSDSTEMFNNPRRQLGSGSQAQVVSIAVIDPDLERRNAVATLLCGLRSAEMIPRVTTLFGIEDLLSFPRQGFHVILLAADGNQDDAMEAIETVCRSGSAIAMAYSPSTNEDLLIDCMRAGVREFLIYPFAPGAVEDAFARVHSRGLLKLDTKRASAIGKSFVFIGAKGGAGGTTAACNFAISMAQDSKRDTILIDLDLPLGDAALVLGMPGEFSTADVLREPARLDATFLRKTSAQHSSGLYVLGAPGLFVKFNFTHEAINSLIEVACSTFEYVVIDAGSRWDLAESRVFDMVSTIYLVTQVGIAELRNANRLITGCLQPYSHKLEIVLNRHRDEMFGIEAKAIEKALTRRAQWQIPNDYAAVREMQFTATPLALKQSGIQRAIQKMARIASGLPAEEPRKKKFGIFGMESRV